MSTPLTCPRCGATEVQSIGEGQYQCTCGALLRLRPSPGPAAIRCARCGTGVPNDAFFCHKCGAEVQRLVVWEPCPACKRPIPADSLFCPYCRAEITLPERAGIAPGPTLADHPRESVGCPACGRTIGPTVSVCPYCGVQVEEFMASLRHNALDNLARAEQLDEERRRQQRLQAEQTEQRTRSLTGLLAILTLIAGLLVLPRRLAEALAGPEMADAYVAPLACGLLCVAIGLYFVAARWWMARGRR